MKTARRALILLVAVSIALLAPHAEAAPARSTGINVRLGASESGNWGGYNQGILEQGKAGGFHQVSANWVVTKATQHVGGRAEHSSTWVGIGGGCLNPACLVGDNTLIQAGTNQDVDASGHATYGAWWEIIPGPQVTITNMTVRPGDVMHVDIHELVSNSNVWIIKVRNTTTGQLFTTTVPYSSTHATAEWIVETPIVIGTGGTGFAAMPNLATTQFSSVMVNHAPAVLKLKEQINLVSNGQRLATPSAPSGNSFRVCTYSSSC